MRARARIADADESVSSSERSESARSRDRVAEREGDVGAEGGAASTSSSSSWSSGKSPSAAVCVSFVYRFKGISAESRRTFNVAVDLEPTRAHPLVEAVSVLGIERCRRVGRRPTGGFTQILLLQVHLCGRAVRIESTKTCASYATKKETHRLSRGDRSIARRACRATHPMATDRH